MSNTLKPLRHAQLHRSLDILLKFSPQAHLPLRAKWTCLMVDKILKLTRQAHESCEG